jgi:hypothetical protein
VRRLIIVVIAALAGCASVHPSADRPQVACEFDLLRRFRYALVVGRDGPLTLWVRRQTLTAIPDLNDKDVHVTSSALIRPGYCPDEQQSIFGERPEPNPFVPKHQK